MEIIAQFSSQLICLIGPFMHIEIYLSHNSLSAVTSVDAL